SPPKPLSEPISARAVPVTPARREKTARSRSKIWAMPSRIAFMLRALSYRNYRLFFGGQIVSLIGSWITMTATSWLVYRLTGSALLLGVVGFAGQFTG